MDLLRLLLLPMAVLLAATGSDARGSNSRKPYYGKYIGTLASYAHGIEGTAFAVDENIIFIEKFSYDGTAPDAFFWVGNKTPRPSPDGDLIPYPEDFKGRDPPVLKAHNKTNLFLKLPAGKKIKDIKWLAVWCRRFTVNFGDVFIPVNLQAPKPRVLSEFKRLAHGLRSGNITVLDARTIYIPNLHYDGAAPDAYFWVGNGTEPGPWGIKVPNEVGKLDPLKGYQGQDIEIQLPENITVYDIDWLAMWCVTYHHNFGHINIPKDLDVPPALGQTKITTSSPERGTDSSEPLSNCREMLDERVQVQWSMHDDMVEIQLSARIREDQYVAFGLSGEQGRSSMVGGDVVVAYYDAKAAIFHADDYYMSATAQCDGRNGVCPDKRIGGQNDVILKSAERRNGVLTVRYTRPLVTNEPIKDRVIPPNGEVNVIAAIGPLNSRNEANSHAAPDKTTEDIRINFSKRNDHQCTNSLYTNQEENELAPWPTQSIHNEHVLTARIGPAGGKRGYTPITGHPSWGIAWWINDKLIPEITVERGQTYTFLVEGGKDRTNPARYHPFYITDSSEGGYGQRSTEEQRRQRVFAGVDTDKDGYSYPTAAGRYCEWVHQTVDRYADFDNLEDYKKTLTLQCDHGEPSVLNWTVAADTPDEVYYQCYTHNNLGWKIHVVDAGTQSRRDSKNLSAGAAGLPSLGLGVVLAVALAVVVAVSRPAGHAAAR